MESVFGLNSKFSISENAIAQTMPEETIILDLESEEYFSLNSLGTMIWDLVVEDISVQEIIGKIAAKCEVDVQILEKDVIKFLSKLLEKKIITVK